MKKVAQNAHELNLEPIAQTETCDQCNKKATVLKDKLCDSCNIRNENLDTYETVGYWIARAFDGPAQNEPAVVDSFEFGVHRAVREITEEMRFSVPYRQPVVEVCDTRPDVWFDASGFLARAFLRVCSPDQLEVLSAQFHRVALEEAARLARPASDTVPVVGGSS